MLLKSALSLVFLTAFMGTAFGADPTALVPIYKTNEPWPELGFDVSTRQVPAIRFEPQEDINLEYIQLWFMNNSSIYQGEVTITLNTDDLREDGQSQPSDYILESWTFQISSQGLLQKDVIYSELKPYLEEGQRYWIVAQSESPPLLNPVWNVSGPIGDDGVIGYYGRLDPLDGEWSVGSSAVPSIQIYGQN